MFIGHVNAMIRNVLSLLWNGDFVLPVPTYLISYLYLLLTCLSDMHDLPIFLLYVDTR